MKARIIQCLALVALVCAAAAVCGCTGTNDPGAQVEDKVAWNLTLTDGTQEKVLTFDEVKALPAWEGYGYAVSTVGIKYGPYTVKGVPLTTLFEQIGGFETGDQVGISAPDGYYWVFDDEQVAGKGFVTFDEDLKEKTSPDLTLVLAYEFNGTAVPEGDGGPLRIVVGTDDPGTITEGSAWVKWVDTIEVERS
ncbi:DMSO/TMAO reductase YedYZ molybdopterin-dependent catalytic subunit [Methanofollis sp. W23]|uniref:molybdopterin-dependent oxidoreductase n=1 Tax=Methanofollis sp. W23 TaxID=2817849 RepID=UPI001AE6C875|nr:molybdopterin-dependent oxidoreductase [Methanofollis sp. W23]MBP2145732.1 DMSO/TMAO reductase YedYZ molybdopterin-dependent catalytic subunit [Methanofollis sp. W23]